MFFNMKYLLKSKKAFTLIEIIIVIVIIWLLMWAMMKFSGSRISVLNNKNVKEQFISNYDELYFNNMMTSYYLRDLYKNLYIYFVVWENNFSYKYEWYTRSYSGLLDVDGWQYKITKLYLNGDEVKNLEISFLPYKFSCYINWSGSQKIANIDILVNSSKTYCFEIDSSNCRLYEVNCD